MADNTNLDGQYVNAAVDMFTEIGRRRRKARIEDNPTNKTCMMHLGMYFIAPMLHLLLVMMCRSGRP
jgi:hypothetical protein